MAIRPMVGSITLKHGAWYWRYYTGGKQIWEKIADRDDEYRNKGDVVPLVNELAARLRPDCQPRHKMTIADFGADIYLPWVKNQKRPSTYHSYRKLWEGHLKGHFGSRLLHQYEPYHATEFLSKLAKRMGRYSVSHVRALMSGVFAHAVALGYVRMNPIHDARLLAAPKAPKQTPHYTVDEMAATLNVLTGEAKVAMALAFLGLRPSEIRGVKWQDIDLINGTLRVGRSVWRTHVNDGGKTGKGRTVTLGRAVRGILSEHKESRPVVLSGWVLEASNGSPLDLNNLSRRVIQKALKAARLEWKGYYGGRRGAETEMNRYTNGNSQITSHHFGHSKEVADSHYIKPLPDETRRAALALDSALSAAIKRQQETQMQ
jgi:integrase